MFSMLTVKNKFQKITEFVFRFAFFVEILGVFIVQLNSDSFLDLLIIIHRYHEKGKMSIKN